MKIQIGGCSSKGNVGDQAAGSNAADEDARDGRNETKPPPPLVTRLPFASRALDNRPERPEFTFDLGLSHIPPSIPKLVVRLP